MRGVAAYCFVGVVALLATCAIAAIIPVPSVSAGPVARDGARVQWVDRSGKGDRIEPATSIIPKLPSRQLRDKAPKMMSGCELVFSPLAIKTRVDNFIGRCPA
jgi:hypothetical protein